jgi:imidazolonepropionase-like amidohydrolase
LTPQGPNDKVTKRFVNERTAVSGFTLRNVRALDASGDFTDLRDVRVCDGIVDAIGSDLPLTDGPEIDGDGLWLLPGFVDCHAHIGCFTEDVLTMASMDVTRWTLETARNLRLLLRLGITSVRDVATGTAGIRDGIADGCVEGPRLLVSGPPLGQTGGHTDGFLPSTGHEAMNGFLMPEYAGRPPYLVDGADEMRRAVRLLLRSGVDWIKLCTTGGLLSSGLDHPRKRELTDDEIATAVSEAALAGVPVASHAYGGSGISAAVEQGVRSIEHGLYLTEEQAALMAARGCWLVPTLTVFYELEELGRDGAIPEQAARKVAEIMPFVGEAVAVAKAAGVRIAMGTDLVRQGRNLSEIAHLHNSGLTVEEALLAATGGGAELCGLRDRGAIAPGYVFDAVLLDEDPSDVSIFTRETVVTGVFQAGRAVMPHERLPAELARTGAAA